MSSPDSLNQALNKVVSYLAQRDHSSLELKKKLKGKFGPTTITQALNIAKDRGWIKSPEELAEQVTQTLHRKNKGHLYIQNYLRKLGLPQSDIDEDWEEKKCRTLLDNRFANWQDMTYEQKQKPLRFLQSRGFTPSTIKKVLL